MRVLVIFEDVHKDHQKNLLAAKYPSEHDSFFLGEALEKILFPGNGPTTTNEALIQDFKSRLNEVRERSPRKVLEQWQREYTDMMEREGKLGDASGLSPEILGDRWYV